VYTLTKLHDKRIPNVGVGVGVGPIEFQLYATQTLSTLPKQNLVSPFYAVLLFYVAYLSRSVRRRRISRDALLSGRKSKSLHALLVCTLRRQTYTLYLDRAARVQWSRDAETSVGRADGRRAVHGHAPDRRPGRCR